MENNEELVEIRSFGICDWLLCLKKTAPISQGHSDIIAKILFQQIFLYGKNNEDPMEHVFYRIFERDLSIEATESSKIV